MINSTDKRETYVALFCELPVKAVFFARYGVCFFVLYDLIFMRHPVFDYLYAANNPTYPDFLIWGYWLEGWMGTPWVPALFLVCIVATLCFALNLAHYASGGVAWLSYLAITQSGFGLSYGAQAFIFLVYPALIALKLPATGLKTSSTVVRSPAVAVLQITLAWIYFENGLSKYLVGDFNAFILSSFAAKNTWFSTWLMEQPDSAQTVFLLFPALEIAAGILLLFPSRARLLGVGCAALVQIGILHTVEVGYFPFLNLALLLLTLTPGTLPRSMEWNCVRTASPKLGWVVVIILCMSVADTAHRYAFKDDPSRPFAKPLEALGIFTTASFFTNFTWYPELEITAVNAQGEEALLSASADDSMNFHEFLLLAIHLGRANVDTEYQKAFVWYLDYFYQNDYRHRAPNLQAISVYALEPGGVRTPLITARPSANIR